MTAAAKPTTAKKTTASDSEKKAGVGLMKSVTPSADLAKVVGSESVPRTEITKRLWEYIKSNNLQNPANKRNILADSNLEVIFGKKEATMFEMAKLISAHLK
jgi:upstream activation factor subunit UAF30